MKAVYNITLKIKLDFEIDDWNFDYLKDGREMADCIGQMICDEVVNGDGIGSYDITTAKCHIE